jgi:hypothetical protein
VKAPSSQENKIQKSNNNLLENPSAAPALLTSPFTGLVGNGRRTPAKVKL